MRLFIAIDFGELKNYLNGLQNKIDKASAKLKETPAFHLTLKFLGDVADNKVEAIKEKLTPIKFQEFFLTLDKIGVFPNENRVRVIWVGVAPQDQVIELQKKIENSLEEFNFKKDFKFHPHITLARVKFVKDKENFRKALKKIDVEKKTIEVKNFKLIKSTLTGEGPVYEDIANFSVSFLN